MLFNYFLQINLRSHSFRSYNAGVVLVRHFEEGAKPESEDLY